MVPTKHTCGLIGEFPKLRGSILGVPIKRTLVFWGLCWGSLILGNYQWTGVLANGRSANTVVVVVQVCNLEVALEL